MVNANSEGFISITGARIDTLVSDNANYYNVILAVDDYFRSNWPIYQLTQETVFLHVIYAYMADL